MPIDIAILGGGPAGLMAAIHAGKAGARVLLMERAGQFGGQLIKQTHKFFGSKSEYAGERGIDIAELLINEALALPAVTAWNNTTVLGYYPEDGMLTAKHWGKFVTVKAKKIIVATGAAEKTLAFPGNDLPGVSGAGAVQTLMNVHGVLPGKRLLILGSGNIGLIVAYQLLQAGVAVAGIVEAAPKIGGYLVHAAKIRRAGIPIYTSHTVKAAYGSPGLTGVTVCRVDNNWQAITGTEFDIQADGLCLAVGLTPLTELLRQAGCRMEYISELGGYVPHRSSTMRTTQHNIYVAGDAAGVEEASVAMVEGKLAALAAVASLGLTAGNGEESYNAAYDQLAALRAGNISAKIRSGLAKVTMSEQTGYCEVI
ncbi:NAD(P)/FAD-dependent oxidoreductase [Sporomusa sphaeroides]|uniref:Hydrogen cyanide synthase subunit HcnB n=2 Tax=Sporomusa TaxID=2375 RepID=A0ABP2C7J2_9FIRM|nr:NAD(P)/FAD-dependent oxidoreductase [Sporomusa sphaeroides]OLS58623.1 hydrogen cyanide synthase subunit HcnB [Sporomusa sphaeroides DSM 2875]CVK19867.1 Hydrogen cyanide synthase subunit HcnB [Sporomusa sphaeroides DSM 2875]SCM79992.1 FAD-dependent pyridine nucleotide-disulfide oxidoreductase [uncultured Sporomusa sp.]